ncbi:MULTISPECIES: hypothetical protein [Enterobacterales]|jgi:hypothetical protein|nr:MULTISPECIES: hypothetical protein [Enterobacterales]MCV1269077.1 hypothetical protein [Escherichia coli]MDP8876280.1 hypothetical protein [Serratia marcescens]
MATSEQKNGDQPDDEKNEQPACERKPGIGIVSIHCAVSLF